MTGNITDGRMGAIDNNARIASLMVIRFFGLAEGEGFEPPARFRVAALAMRFLDLPDTFRNQAASVSRRELTASPVSFNEGGRRFRVL